MRVSYVLLDKVLLKSKVVYGLSPSSLSMIRGIPNSTVCSPMTLRSRGALVSLTEDVGRPTELRQSKRQRPANIRR